MSRRELFVYLYGVGEKRVAIKENQSIGLYPASLALDAVFPNGGALTKAVGISWVSYGFYIKRSGEIALPRLCGAASHHTVRRWTLSLSAPDNSFVRETTFVFSLWGLIGRLWDCCVDELWGCFDCWMKSLALLFMCRPTFEFGTRHRSVFNFLLTEYNVHFT